MRMGEAQDRVISAAAKSSVPVNAIFVLLMVLILSLCRPVMSPDLSSGEAAFSEHQAATPLHPLTTSIFCIPEKNLSHCNASGINVKSQSSVSLNRDVIEQKVK